jgi:hypothetical protein
MVQDAVLAEPVKVKPCNVKTFTTDVDEDATKLTVIIMAVALT